MNITLNRFLCFRLENENYALPLADVKEVLAIPDITPIPQVPNYFLGIMNLRGQVISVIDLRLKIGLKGAKSAETCIIIIEHGETCVGIVVDEVRSVMTLQEGDLKPAPDMGGAKRAQYITGVVNRDEELILTLDIARALDLQNSDVANIINRQKSA